MSNSAMSSSASKVNSGPPIWLWLILVPLTLAVIAGIYVASIPPDLDQAYDDAAAALSDPNGKEAFDKNLAILEGRPGYEDHVRYLQGRIAMNLSRDPKALKLFAEIPDDSPLKAEAWRRTGDCYRRMGQLDKAIAAYRQSIDDDSEGGLDARLNLATLYFASGAIKLAIDELDTNIEQNPEHDDSHMLRARIRLFREEFDLAREDFDAVLVSPGKFSSAPPSFIAEYFKCLMQLQDVETLEEVARAHLSASGDSATQASVLVEIGEYAEATLALKAIEDPSGQSPEFARAQLKLLLAEGKNEEASRVAEKVVFQITRNEEVMTMAAAAFAADGETRMQKIAEENALQLKDLKSQLTAAIDKVSENITDAPGRAEVARLYRQLGDYTQMNTWYQMAVSLDKSFTDEYLEARSGKTFPREPLVSFDEPEEEQPEEEQPVQKSEKSELKADEAEGKDATDTDATDTDATNTDATNTDAASDTATGKQDPKEEAANQKAAKDDKPKEDAASSEKQAEEKATPAATKTQVDAPETEEPAAEEPAAAVEKEQKAEEPAAKESKSDS